MTRRTFMQKLAATAATVPLGLCAGGMGTRRNPPNEAPAEDFRRTYINRVAAGRDGLAVFTREFGFKGERVVWVGPERRIH